MHTKVKYYKEITHQVACIQNLCVGSSKYSLC